MTHELFLLIIVALAGIAILAGRFLGWDSCRKGDDADQSEYLDRWSDIERARRDMRAMRGGK